MNSALKEIFIGVVVSRKAHSHLVIARLFVCAPEYVGEPVQIRDNPVSDLESCVCEDKASLVGGIDIPSQLFKLLVGNVAVKEVV